MRCDLQPPRRTTPRPYPQGRDAYAWPAICCSQLTKVNTMLQTQSGAIIVTGVAIRLLDYDYGVGNRNGGSNPIGGKRFISPPRWPDRLWSPSDLLLNEYLGLCPGLKQLLRVPHELPPSSAKVENEWGYTSISSYAFMACRGITVFLVTISTIYIYRLSVLKEVKMKLVTGMLQQKCEPRIYQHWGEVPLAVEIIRFVVFCIFTWCWRRRMIRSGTLGVTCLSKHE